MIYTSAVQFKISPAMMRKSLYDIIPSEYQGGLITISKPQKKNKSSKSQDTWSVKPGEKGININELSDYLNSIDD